jgi:hypothetical protein
MKTKQLKILFVVLCVLLTAGMADAARRGRAHAAGIRGTITSMGTSGFVLSVHSKKSSTLSTGSSTLNVLCDTSTKFMQGAATVDPSEIKEGITVRVIGATIGPDELHATTVTIEVSHKKKK